MILTKSLFIVRHGHAGFDQSSDKHRSLTVKGQMDIQFTAEFIKQKCKEFNLGIDLCISSDSKRTCQTSEIVIKHLAINKFQKHSELYSTVASTWIEYVIATSAENLVLVGHNPTLSQLIMQLVGQRCLMKTADCALIQLGIKDNEIILPAKLLGYFNNE